MPLSTSLAALGLMAASAVAAPLLDSEGRVEPAVYNHPGQDTGAYNTTGQVTGAYTTTGQGSAAYTTTGQGSAAYTTTGQVSAAYNTTGQGSAAHTNTTGQGQNVVYWGQNGGDVVANNDLASYCTGSSGIDIIVLAFLYQYGNGQLLPSGTIGQSCSIANGQPQGCESLGQAIGTCQARGIKVVLSLGGATGAYALSSQQEAQAIGQHLWDAYGNSRNAGSAPRPFGQVFVNGWDFDIESNRGNEHYPALISTLRSNFGSDPANKYVVTGAPQCPVPEPNMNQIITAAQFDYLFVQFYNNPGCSVDGAINWAAWKSNLANTPSAAAKLFLGVPASPLGATGTQSGAKYYLAPSGLASLAAQYKSDPAFGGIMMWNAGFSDANVANGCTYAQQAKRILTTGSTC